MVGRNGVGKSTLFKLITGELSPDGGEIGVPRGATIASVAQEHPATPVSLLDTILVADTVRDALHTELETRRARTHGRDLRPPARNRRRPRPRARQRNPRRPGFSTEDLARPMSHFSGGWRMRVALAAALFAEPDLLLLDEPTNYLDLEGAMWLEARLRVYPERRDHH